MSVLVAEAHKVRAFVRRDFLTMLSYRVAFVSDLLAIDRASKTVSLDSPSG